MAVERRAKSVGPRRSPVPSHDALGEGQITVYYDGACPICRRHRRLYESLAGRGGEPVRWFDITDQEQRLRKLGIDPHKALTALHLMDEQGQVLSELDAYILLLQRVRMTRPLAWLIGRPLFRPALSRLYRWMVLRRLRRSGRL